MGCSSPEAPWTPWGLPYPPISLSNIPGAVTPPIPWRFWAAATLRYSIILLSSPTGAGTGCSPQSTAPPPVGWTPRPALTRARYSPPVSMPSHNIPYPMMPLKRASSIAACPTFSPGSGGGTPFNASPYYPSDCGGIVGVFYKTITRCTCADHIPSECSGCPSWYDTDIPYYYCQEYNPNEVDWPGDSGGTGGVSMPDPADLPSVAVAIRPEECVQRIPGDFDGDCQLDAYEVCMLNGHGHDVCECVENGGNMDVCVTEQNCEKLKDMLDPNKADIVPELENLKNAVNPNGEVGVLFKKNNGTYTNADIPPTNTPNVPVTSGGDTYGAAHTHPTFGGFPMFSWADVYVLANLYNNAATDVKNEVTYMMVGKETNLSAEASVYALVVDDINTLNAKLTNDKFKIANEGFSVNHSSSQRK